MKEKTLSVPLLGLIAITRVALGVGIGLLLSRKFDEREQRAAGLALLAVGALTTLPLVASVIHAPSRTDERLVA
jgi:Tfp pilus assembly protein PilN